MKHQDEETARLFADLVLADGRILNIERCLVELLACRLAPKERSRHLDLFQKRLSELSANKTNSVPAVTATQGTPNARDGLETLAKLWRIALCDGELHAEEERLIYEYVDRQEIPRKIAVRVEQTVADAT